MQKYKSNITMTSGAAVRNVPVTVFNEDGSLAALYLDREGTVGAPNPMHTEADGTFYFYAANGRYSLRTTVNGVTITDGDVVLLADPAELAVSGPIAAAIKANAGATGKVNTTQQVVTFTGTQDMPLVSAPAGGLMLVQVDASSQAPADLYDIELYDGAPAVASLRYHARMVSGPFRDAIPVYCRMDAGTLYLRLVNLRTDAAAITATIALRHMFGGLNGAQ